MSVPNPLVLDLVVEINNTNYLSYIDTSVGSLTPDTIDTIKVHSIISSRSTTGSYGNNSIEFEGPVPGSTPVKIQNLDTLHVKFDMYTYDFVWNGSVDRYTISSTGLTDYLEIRKGIPIQVEFSDFPSIDSSPSNFLGATKIDKLYLGDTEISSGSVADGGFRVHGSSIDNRPGNTHSTGLITVAGVGIQMYTYSGVGSPVYGKPILLNQTTGEFIPGQSFVTSGNTTFGIFCESDCVTFRSYWKEGTSPALDSTGALQYDPVHNVFTGATFTYVYSSPNIFNKFHVAVGSPGILEYAYDASDVTGVVGEIFAINVS